MSMKNYTPGDGILHETKADFGIRTIQNTLHFVQYDKTLPVVAVSLMHNGRSYTLPDRAQIFIRWGKKDRTYVRKECAVNQERNVAYFEVDEQMTIFDGQVNPILEIIMDGKRAGSSPLPIVIDKNPVQDSDVESQVSDSMIDTILKVESQLKNKRDKTFGKKTVYTVDDQGNQSALPYSEAPDADSVVRRTDAGTVKTNKPTEANDAANKEYVDTFIGESVKVIRDCVDEIGITCYEGCSKGLELSHQKSVFELPMINGQTGRASENYFKFVNKKYSYGSSSVEAKNSSLIFNGSGDEIGGHSVTKVDTFIPAGNYTFECKENDNGYFLIGLNAKDGTEIKIQGKFANVNITKDIYSIGLFIYKSNAAGKTFNNKEFKFNLVKGTYTLENIPTWKPHNDNLVNSHCVVKTTGANIWDEEWEVGGIDGNSGNNNDFPDRIRSKNYILLTKGKYIIRGTEENYNLFFYNSNKQFLGKQYMYPASGAFTITEDNMYVKFALSIKYGNVYKGGLMLNSGTEPLPYTPHTEDVIADIGELGKWDSIDNVAKKKYLATHIYIPSINDKFIQLQSDDTFIGCRITIPNAVAMEKPDPKFSIINDNNISYLYSQMSTVEHFYLFGNPEVGKSTIEVYLYKSRLNTPDLDGLKKYIVDNLQFGFKTKTITEIDMSSNPLPFTMRIEKGGMELQETIGDALPYNLTKMYSVNKAAQIDSNSNAINRNADSIDALNYRLDHPVEKPTFIKTVQTEQAVITGETGSDAGLAVDEQQSMLINRVKGNTRRASPNLINLGSSKSFVLRGVNVSKSIYTGAITLKGTADSAGGRTDRLSEYIQLTAGRKYILQINKIDNDNIVFFLNDSTTNVNIIGISKTSKESKYGLIVEYTPVKNTNCYLGVNVNAGASYDETIYVQLTEEQEYPFHPYDDRLINADCKFISTSENLWDEEWEQGFYNDDTGEPVTGTVSIRSKNFIPIIPNTTYTISKNVGVMNAFFYTKDKKFIKGNWTLTFKTPIDAYYMRFRTTQYYMDNHGDAIATYHNDIMLNYGSTPQPYTPHTEDTISFGKLGIYDTHDNITGNDTIGGSEIITLDGSPDENWKEEIGQALSNSLLYYTDIVRGKGTSNVYNNLFGKEVNTIWAKDVEGMAIDSAGRILIRLNKTRVSNFSNLLAYLKSNPIQLVYKLAQPYTRENPTGRSLLAIKGGMQYQEGELPYSEIHKEYAVNLEAQLDANRKGDAAQQAQLNKIYEVGGMVPSENRIDNIINNGKIFTVPDNGWIRYSIEVKPSKFYGLQEDSFLKGALTGGLNTSSGSSTAFQALIPVVKGMTIREFNSDGGITNDYSYFIYAKKVQ